MGEREAQRTGKPNELLLQKLSSIAFTLDEEEALDITGVVERLRDSLDRDKVTKRFYDHFKSQKDAFRGFIEGLTDGGMLDWYTSLMLNRLMFCYFLQRKGFLDRDTNYLSNRLDRVQDELGEGKFHSFYKSFLRRLFHEGLGQLKDERPAEIKRLIGDIPYLNGGIFEEHKIERDHPNLHIPDKAFERIFAFLDQYDWHLDDRPIAKGNEINPEILGYVFEKYTNQKEMGAYYTKEDITDYIAKNCIVPFLLDAAGEKLGEASWNLLREDPDRYIYPAVGHGIFCDYRTGAKLEAPFPLPDYIENGIDTVKFELRKRRARWNEPATPALSLPTEIWRETVARRQRCEELRKKLSTGEIRFSNDLITLNLNLRQFAQDVVENAGPELLSALFKAIRKLSVLDPTCGSGAFLFAALNILEPLYRASLDRMRILLGDWETRAEKHPNYRKEFTALLDQAVRHPNENYFIFKSIIVHNLYGVDIMEEAVEICKLRLFLKLAAQLEPGQEIEPLPDIDFNIRAGNTLVGYATRDEVRRCMTQFGDGQMRLGVEDELQSYSRFEEDAENVDKAFQLFQKMQDEYGMNPVEFRDQKRLLSERLQTLRNQLDRFLAADYDKRNIASDAAFTKWRGSHQPFHWFVEFYGILASGGFDTIIGNPPYVELTSIAKQYEPLNFLTKQSGNLYALCTERAVVLLQEGGRFGFQQPVTSTIRMHACRSLLLSRCRVIWSSTFDDRPSKLFDGMHHARLAIILSEARAGEANIREAKLLVTRYNKWFKEERPLVFHRLLFTEAHVGRLGVFPKIWTSLERSLLSTMCAKQTQFHRLQTDTESPHRIFYKITGVGSWFTITHRPPRFFRGGEPSSSTRERTLSFPSEEARDQALCLLNSSLFYWFYQVRTNCRDFNPSDYKTFPIPATLDADRFNTLAQKLKQRLDSSAGLADVSHSKTGAIQYERFRPRTAKEIIDEIDAVLAQHYGFTEEELDFIVNYDIKYRMGLSGGTAGANEDE